MELFKVELDFSAVFSIEVPAENIFRKCVYSSLLVSKLCV
jgi:hypothetical protein